MATYKITNITNLTGKRDRKYNSELKIDYIDKMTKKNVTIRPNESIYLTIQTLPMSIHKLRIKNLISVIEIGSSEMANIINKNVQKQIENKKVEEEIHEEAMKKQARKKSKKEEEIM